MKISRLELAAQLAKSPKDWLELIDSILRRVCESDIAYSQANHNFQQNGNTTHTEAEEWQMPEF
ncbi:hypothetical protein [Nostoc sp.]|uniref:hypothetical protein n=1 Tax=Nostoc sp. TaxID=1180 RepID=UPI002FF85486